MPSVCSKSTSIPIIDLRRQYLGIRDEVLAAIERVCAAQQFVLGPEVEALEAEIAALIGAKAAVGCSSGTDALWLALLAAGVRAGDRVITTGFTFFASASSIARIGAVPVFVDIDPVTLNLDPEKTATALSQRGRLGGEQAAGRFKKNPEEGRSFTAMVAVHLYGQCADMDALQDLAREHGLALVEDAAQAIGAKWREQNAGAIGTCAAFSFYPTKNLSAYGEAGLVTTQDLARARHMRQLRNQGSEQRYVHTELGWNARLDSIQAAVLRVKLKYLEEWNRQRRERAEAYDRLLRAAGLASGAPSPVKILGRSQPAYHVFHQYVIRVRQRDKLQAFLSERGIQTEAYYPIPLHLQPAFSYLGYKEGDLPESELAAKEVLALPMFAELTEEEQRQVVAAVAEFYS